MVPYPNSAAKIALGVGKYVQQISVTLVNGQTLTLTNASLLGDTGVEIEDSVSASDSFQVGAAIINQCCFTIANFNGTYDNINFLGADLSVSIGVDSEIKVKGKFVVIDQQFSDSAISITAYDYMSKFDKPYSLSNLAYPATITQIVSDACAVCGVTAPSSVPNGSVSIPERPDDETLTFREVLSWCAQIAGCFARIDRNGALTIAWYDMSTLGNASAAAGTYHDIHSIFSKSVSKSDVAITGVKIIIGDNDEHITGTDGYMLEVSGNGFITTDNVNSILSYLGSRFIGMAFRKIEVAHLSDPRIEAGDVMKLTVGSDSYWGIVSYTKFTAGSNQSTRSDAEDTVYNTATRYTEVTKLAVKTTAEIAKEAQERQTAITQATDMISGTYGGNLIINRDSTGKPFELLIMDADNTTDAVNVWRFNAGGLGHSSSGYNGPFNDIALTADGKINADLITTGTLRSMRIENGANGEFTVDEDGNVSASSINITGGSIRITTQTESYDVIKLTWINPSTQVSSTSEYAPIGLTTQNVSLLDDESESTLKKGIYQGGGLWLYVSNTLRCRLLYSSLNFNDSTGVRRSVVDTSGLGVYDTDGVMRAYYYSDGLSYNDANSVNRAIYAAEGTWFRDSSGKTRTVLGRLGLTFYDTDGSTPLTEFNNTSLTVRDSSNVRRYYRSLSTTLLYDASNVLRTSIAEGEVRVNNASGNAAAGISAAGLEIRNASTYGVTIDGIGKTGTWQWKQFTDTNGTAYWVPCVG